MKNYEKYADEIRKYRGHSFCNDFIIPHILKSSDCGDTYCDVCRIRQMIWLLEEYEEPETDWSKVAVDTPILVRNYEDEVWIRRHFAKYEGGKVYAWQAGGTSWTEDHIASWKYAELAESEE